jgi:hypothetical protein
MIEGFDADGRAKISRGRVLFFSPPPTLIQKRRRDLKEGSVKQTSREGSWISNSF